MFFGTAFHYRWLLHPLFSWIGLNPGIQRSFLVLRTERGYMDLCTLEDAFPNIDNGPSNNISGLPYVGGKDGYSSKEERRAARKLAKKRKGSPADIYSDSIDPDRPAVERMKPVDTVAEQKDSFVSPVLPKASCLFSDPGTPTYFGAGMEDQDEAFSDYSAAPRDDINYRLQPDFTKSDMLKGAQKAASEPLPEPPLSDSWKPLTPGANYTSYFSEIPAPKKSEKVKYPKPDPDWGTEAHGSSAAGPVAANEANQVNNHQDALLKRIDELMGRLEQLEKKNKDDSQTEILMFVGTGLFLLMSFELFTRR